MLDLSAYLHRHHGEKVVILIDEYDEPIHAGYVHGYASRVLDLLRALLGAGLKGNRLGRSKKTTATPRLR